jgi:hypothetical protein
MTRACRGAAVALVCALVSAAAAAAQAVPTATDKGAWTLWSYPDLGKATPRFFSLLAARFNTSPPDLDSLPFRYSVAVLVGVQDYKSFESFGFVRSDVEALRSYLLGEGGFDQVYVLRPGAETPDAVEQLMRNELRSTLDPRDRLFFYFSGHGTSFNGTTGYMAFPRAKPDDFVTDLLPVSELREWSYLLPARHALFVLDSCSAGFGVRDKSLADLQPTESVIEFLKGHGSRIVLTAGTEKERAIEVQNAHGAGSSLFTAELLYALQGQFATPGPFDVVLTTEEIFSGARKQTIIEAGKLDKVLTPDIEYLQKPLYKGTFLFLNPRSNGKEIHPDLARRLGFPDAARPLDANPAQPAELVVGLKNQHRRGSSLTLDFGRVGNGPIERKLTLEVLAKEPVPLELTVAGDVDASFTGGLLTAVASPGKLLELDMSLSPKKPAPSRIEVRSGQRLLTTIHITAELAESEIVREVSSGARDSGRLKSFSNPYQLCLGPAPAGYSLVPGSDEFWLTGDRRCGAWSSCEVARRDNTDVCWSFRLQGHDEFLFNDGIRQSEGHLRARYALRESEPVLRKDGD